MMEPFEDKLEELEKIIKEKEREIHRLKSIIDNVPGSIYWKDKNGMYLGRNQFSAESMKSMGFPWREEDIVGKSDYDLFAKEMADQFRSHDIHVMQSGKSSSHEERVTLDDKTIVQLSTKAPLFDQEGKVEGVVGNTVDITYLKEVEDRLRDAKEEAEKANQLKSAFIRDMEHDIRTPFSGIYSIATILEKNETDTQKKHYLNAISQSAKELLDYCNSILDFDRINSGNLPIIERKFNIRELIKSIITIEALAAESKKLNLVSTIQEDIPDILIGDDYRLKRILINLVSNAIKFTNEGYVKITTQIGKAVNDKNIILKFLVEDSGIGIPPEKQLIIYEKFNRLVPSNTGLYRGSGLGLTIVKQFIEELNAEIELKSQVSVGSTFACVVPFKLPLINEILL